MSDLISRQAAIDMLAAMQGQCTSKAALIQNSKIWQQIKDFPSVQPDTSRIENALRGKSAEEQYDFIWWLMRDYGMQFTDTRTAVIEWLRGVQDATD